MALGDVDHRWRALRSRVTLPALVALLVAPVLVLAVFASQFASAAVRRATQDRAEVTASVGATLVQQQVSALGLLIDSYAARPSLVAAMEGHSAGYDDPAVVRHFDDLMRREPGFAAVFVADPAGRAVDISPRTPSALGKSFAFRDWYRGVSASGRVYVSDVYESAAAGNPRVIGIAAPIRAGGLPTGEVLGYFVGAYGTDALQAYVEKLATDQGVALIVVDSAGVVVASPRGPREGLEPLRAPWVARTLAGRSVTGSLQVSRPIRELGWGITSRVAEDRGYGRDRDVILALLALLLVGQAVGVWLLRRFYRQRERAELERSTLDVRLRNVLEASSESILATDRDGRIVMVNPAALRLFGYRAEELLGRSAHPLLHHTRRDGTAYAEEDCPLHQVLRTGRPLRRDSELLWHRDGTPVPVMYSVAALRDGDDVVGAVEIITDVTERDRYEQDLARVSREAQSANRLKSEFLANMSHEIRTPMNGVLGMTDLLLRTELTQEQRGFAETAQRSAQTLLDVINDILDLSKVEAGQLEIERAPVEIRGVVEDAAEMLATVAHTKDVELVTSVAAEVPTVVLGDATRVRQVLVNLLSNAVRFTDSGEVAVFVQVAETDDDGLKVRFDVVDTGIGIPDEAQQRIFDAFSQEDASTTRRQGGTGLGLAIARQLVEAMGGSISLTSAVGDGSRFSVLLPFATAGERYEEVTASLAGKRVLVIDDNLTNLQVLVGMLAHHGVEVTPVQGALDALGVLRQAARDDEPFDVVLVDYRMPDLDGLDLIAAVIDEPSFVATKFVLLTSAIAQDRASAARARGIACLTKPIREAALLRELGARPMSRPEQVERVSTLQESVDGPRVLVAEDNPVNQTVARLMLTRLGCDVEIAENGRRAVESVAASSYDLVFMDCQMPTMDGFEATRAIRHQEAGTGRHLPIVAMTAGAMREEEERCMAAGMDDFLAKPVMLADLQGILARWLRAGAAAKPSVSAD